MATRFDLRNPLFVTYAYASRHGWLDHPWAKRLFREAYFLYKKHYEDPFSRLVKLHPELFRGGHVVDAGANIGYTAACFASVVDSDRFVYAFEPEETNFRELVRTAGRASTRGRIRPVRKALGDGAGTLDLWVNQDHHADHRIITEALEKSAVDLGRRELVEAVSLDDFARQECITGRIRFVKIDVQGYELPVCLGMREAMDLNPDLSVAIEYSPEHLEALGFKAAALLSFFRERHFHAYALSRRRGAPLLRPWDWSTIDVEGYMDIVFCRRRLL
jgi:FkbM family methyltransferase